VTGSGLPGLAQTSYSGRYSLGGLAPGSYHILFTANCVGGGAAFAPQWFNRQPSRSRATTVRVTSGGMTSSVNAALYADGGISGTVRVSGRAAAGVCVIASAVTGTAGPVLAGTAADGTYEIGDLPPGRYTVKFTAGCGASSYPTQWYDGARTLAEATRVRVEPGAITPLIDAH
jgi:hypothetical protein